MASRIDNVSNVPTTLVPTYNVDLKAERVQDLPQRFSLKDVDTETLQAINRLLLNLKAVKEDTAQLKLAGVLTVDDLKGLVVLSNEDFAILNDVIASHESILLRLDDIESRLAALETP